MVRVLNTTDSPRLVMFHVLGRAGADPDAMSEEIRDLCKEWGISMKGIWDSKKKTRRTKAGRKLQRFPS